jgi:hypothetical protein
MMIEKINYFLISASKMIVCYLQNGGLITKLKANRAICFQERQMRNGEVFRSDVLGVVMGCYQ